MGERAGLWDLLAGVIVLAIVYMLVRPGSKGTQIVTVLGNALTALVAQTTGFAETKGQGA
jgi:uncharacterized membrane protein YdcZ (DUF606 family)